jgi:putative phosphoesterase
MKTLILSDIHGNFPALSAILEEEKHYDVCLFLGDVVDYGPFPNECIAFLQREMDFGVIGNHDNALAYAVDCGCRGEFKRYSTETRAWHKNLIGKSELAFLRSLQPLNHVTIDGNSLVLAHASPQGDLFRYLLEKEIDEVLDGITAQIVFLGHTHVQYRKHVGDKLVANPGSVGLPRNGGQACYAILEGGAVTLKRLPYDVEETIRALAQSPISQESKEGLSRVLRGE